MQQCWGAQNPLASSHNSSCHIKQTQSWRTIGLCNKTKISGSDRSHFIWRLQVLVTPFLFLDPMNWAHVFVDSSCNSSCYLHRHDSPPYVVSCYIEVGCWCWASYFLTWFLAVDKVSGVLCFFLGPLFIHKPGPRDRSGPSFRVGVLLLFENCHLLCYVHSSCHVGLCCLHADSVPASMPCGETQRVIRMMKNTLLTTYSSVLGTDTETRFAPVCEWCAMEKHCIQNVNEALSVVVKTYTVNAVH